MTKEETKPGVTVLRRMIIPGAILDLRTARKDHSCAECPEVIVPGEEYIEKTLAGAGLGSIKFPTRLHQRCIDKHLSKGGEKC